HIGEELWAILGNEQDLSYAPWPTYDEAALIEDEVEVVFQINGKVRAKASVARDLSKEELEKTAMDDDSIKEQSEKKLKFFK
ncbi:class I tRNA ligase family protein, partial [Enterococcus mundtii]|uniref:class I tRNA ligase family protein n=1 Tax=Enterococcus mundtii TaxID=53346 RepID=UPI0003683747